MGGVRDRRFLLPVLTTALGVAAIFAVALVLDLDGYGWHDETYVPRDGQTHVVDVDGDALVWTPEFESTPRCRLSEAPDGPALTVTGPQPPMRHDTGKNFSYQSTWEVSPDSGQVAVTCAGSVSRPGTPVVVTDKPWGPAWLGDAGNRTVALVLSLATAVLCTVLSVGFWGRRRPGQQ